MEAQVPPPRPAAATEGRRGGAGRGHTLGEQETLSGGGRRRNVPPPAAVGGDRGRLQYFFGPIGTGALDGHPGRQTPVQFLLMATKCQQHGRPASRASRNHRVIQPEWVSSTHTEPRRNMEGGPASPPSQRTKARARAGSQRMPSRAPPS